MIFSISILIQGNAEGFSDKRDISIASNPLKLIYSLVNLEIDYALFDELSFHVFSEYLLCDYIIKREDHPDFVIRTGPRFLLPFPGESCDTYIGPFISFSNSFLYNTSGIEAGVEMGGRYKLISRLFIQLKGMVMYSITTSKVIPGFEGLLGYSIKL